MMRRLFMKRKIKIRKIFAILLLTISVLSLCSCGKKTVDVEIITHERSVKNTDRVTTDYLVLGEGEKFENLKVISIDKNTVTFSFNLEEKKTISDIKNNNKIQKQRLAEYKAIKVEMTNPFTSILSQKLSDFLKNKLPSINSYGEDVSLSNSDNYFSGSGNTTEFSGIERNLKEVKKSNLSSQNKKDIVINFLENQDIKKYIYDSIYQKFLGIMQT